MAKRELKAGIRFNDPNLKYISLIFVADEETNIYTCTIDVDGTFFGIPMKVRGTTDEWAPIEDNAGSNSQLSTQATRATKTTKKTAKESK